MGKYRDFIDGLMGRGKFKRPAYDALVRANNRAFPFLVEALHNHEDEDIREICAEILGDRKSTKAVPALIEALKDESLFVRQDALWSIEKICKYQSGGLYSWLELDPENPPELHQRVLEWWELNKRYIEKNEYL